MTTPVARKPRSASTAKDVKFADGRLLVGDCRIRLGSLPDGSIDAVVCDPPYEVGIAGKAWDKSGIAFDEQVWSQCLRVLAPGGLLVACGSPRTWHRLAVAIEDAGFEILDSIAWLYGQGKPPANNRLKPGFEPLIVARKPGAQHHLNIEVGRLAHRAGEKAGGTRAGEPSAERRYTQNSVLGLAQKPGIRGGSIDGRWPSNVALDADVAAELPKSQYFYCAKAPASQRPRVPSGERHPSVKPLDLMEWILSMVVPGGGTVLDPFLGSGTTAVAATKLGHPWIGCEITESYLPLIKARVRAQEKESAIAAATSPNALDGEGSTAQAASNPQSQPGRGPSDPLVLRPKGRAGRALRSALSPPR
jgi:DNA modification methylase